MTCNVNYKQNQKDCEKNTYKWDIRIEYQDWEIGEELNEKKGQINT